MLSKQELTGVHMKPKRSILDENLSRTDPRVKQILVKMKKENYRPDALIEILHTAQNSFGYLPMNVLAFITKELKVPPSRVYSTVTFYHFFLFEIQRRTYMPGLYRDRLLR